MADSTDLQQMGRTAHLSSSGMDITQTFYTEPFDSWPTVVEVLQGKVEKVGEKWKRTPPARDSVIKTAYCNETLIDFAHPDGMASSDKLELAGGNLIDKIQDTPPEPALGAAGAKIVAHYRPLVTAWQPDGSDSQPNDPDNPDDRIWDWMEPKFETGVRMIPWPDGLFVTEKTLGATHSHAIDPALSTPLAVPITDFSIKRMLVGEIPWDQIDAASGALNSSLFPEENTPPANGLPKFRPRTLKFEGADIRNMMDSRGRRWFEIVYRFKRIHLLSNRIFDHKGNGPETGWVTWNHIFMHPSTFGWQGPTGWYEVWRGQQVDLGLGVIQPFQTEIGQKSAGLLFDDTSFEPLFKLNQ